jgi:hypothetical protein
MASCKLELFGMDVLKCGDACDEARLVWVEREIFL